MLSCRLAVMSLLIVAVVFFARTSGGTITEVDTDDKFETELSMASNKLVVGFITDNSSNECVNNMKMYVNNLSIICPNLKIIQLNLNTGNCENIKAKYRTTSLPLLFFENCRKRHAAHVTGFNPVAAEAEISVLMSEIKVVDTNEEFKLALSNQANEFIIINHTNNSLDENDREMKKFLAKVSISQVDVKVVQVNMRTEDMLILGINTSTMLTFLKRGRLQLACVLGFNTQAIDAEISNLMSRSIVVNNAEEFTNALMTRDEELIVMFFTDNSLDNCDCKIKEYLGEVSRDLLLTLKIIQVNQNSPDCPGNLGEFGITVIPSVLFLKYGNLHAGRLSGCSEDVNVINAIKAEISCLYAKFIVVNSDGEFDNAIMNATSELIIVFVTDNIMDDPDCEVKMLLSGLSLYESDLKIIRFNTNTGLCEKTISENDITLFPSLYFMRYGKTQKVLTGFNQKEILDAVTKLKSTGEIPST